MIKVGQIYKDNKKYTSDNCLFVITRIGNEVAYFVTNIGYAKGRDTILLEEDIKDKDVKLIAEYPTWQEAVNSKEFKGETRMTCKQYCPVWNDIDHDCEIYGEHHFTPRTCPHYNIEILEKKMMTEMLQKTENVAKNVANENSQHLTEQWKKGELPEGHYYVKDGENMIAEYLDGYFYNDGNPMTSFNGGVDEVIAPVPPYEVYKELIDGRKLLREYIKDITNENAQLKEYERTVTSYNMKPIDYDIACETVNKLLDDNKRLKHDVGNLGYKIKNQRHEIDNRLKEIEKLKDLLKECREEIASVEWDSVLNDRNQMKLLTKIDEALR